jgi:hypothetical protein
VVQVAVMVQGVVAIYDAGRGRGRPQPVERDLGPVAVGSAFPVEEKVYPPLPPPPPPSTEARPADKGPMKGRNGVRLSYAPVMTETRWTTSLGLAINPPRHPSTARRKTRPRNMSARS